MCPTCPSCCKTICLALISTVEAEALLLYLGLETPALPATLVAPSQTLG